MKKTILAIIVLFLTGCCSPTFERPPWAGNGEPWDTSYLIEINTSGADLEAAADKLENHYWNHVQVEGVVQKPWRSSDPLEHPDRYGNGGDSAIYTGTALAAWSFQWAVRRDQASLENMLKTLNAVDLLTHIAGDGVICRVVFPLNMKEKFGYPEKWLRRQPFIGENQGYGYYTRATKDQFTGLLLGLSVCWKITNETSTDLGVSANLVKATITRITRDIHNHLIKYDWYPRCTWQ